MASTIHPGNVLTMLEYTKKKKTADLPAPYQFPSQRFLTCIPPSSELEAGSQPSVFRVLALKPMSGFPRSADTIQTVSYALSLGISNWTLGLNVDL